MNLHPTFTEVALSAFHTLHYYERNAQWTTTTRGGGATRQIVKGGQSTKEVSWEHACAAGAHQVRAHLCVLPTVALQHTPRQNLRRLTLLSNSALDTAILKYTLDSSSHRKGSGGPAFSPHALHLQAKQWIGEPGVLYSHGRSEGTLFATPRVGIVPVDNKQH